MHSGKTTKIVRTATVVGIAAIFSSFQSVRAEEMLSLFQRHRGLGNVEVEITRNSARIVQPEGNCFVVAGPDWDVHIFNQKRKRMAKLLFKNFVRNGPKNIEYLEGATEWPLVTENPQTSYKHLPAKLYALPFKHKDGRLVELKRAKAGSYYVSRNFPVDPHILTFLQQMFHLQPADGVPLKFVKLGHPYQFGQGLAYNRQEGTVTILDTITAQLKPAKKFVIPQGYKMTNESDVTMGDKTEDMREIIEQLN